MSTILNTYRAASGQAETQFYKPYPFDADEIVDAMSDPKNPGLLRPGLDNCSTFPLSMIVR